MANYILASVGNAQGFREVNGKMHQVLSAKTLTDSSISLTSTMEEIRAGQGAKLYGRFSHDTGMTATLTDAMFKMEYIALQTGSNIDSVGGNCMFTEQLEYEGGEDEDGFTLTNTPVAMGKSCGLDKIGVWFRKVGCGSSDDYTFVELTSTQATAKKFTSTEAEDGAKYCVTYFKNEEGAREMLINANFVPAEMILMLTTKLFAADAKGNKTGGSIGEVTIKIPRFQLDGQVDLSMAMSSAATINLSGTALATDAESCAADGIYCEIIELVTGRKWHDGLRSVVYSSEDKTLYGIYNGGYTAPLDSTLTGITITPTTGTPTTVTVTDGTVTKTFTVVSE